MKALLFPLDMTELSLTLFLSPLSLSLSEWRNEDRKLPFFSQSSQWFQEKLSRTMESDEETKVPDTSSWNRSNLVHVLFCFFLTIIAYVCRFTSLIPLTNQTIDCKDVIPYREASSQISFLKLDDNFFVSLLLLLALIVVSKTLKHWQVLCV